MYAQLSGVHGKRGIFKVQAGVLGPRVAGELPPVANNRAGFLREIPGVYLTVTWLDSLRLSWIY